jgi:hypothetical protein
MSSKAIVSMRSIPCHPGGILERQRIDPSSYSFPKSIVSCTSILRVRTEVLLIGLT